MPHSDIHKAKFKKNLALGGAIFAFIALIWIITMIKLSGA